MIDIDHKETRTIISGGDFSAEFWHQEMVLYFQIEIFGLDVKEARRVAEFINLAAAELERFKKERHERQNLE